MDWSINRLNIEFDCHVLVLYDSNRKEIFDLLRLTIFFRLERSTDLMLHRSSQVRVWLQYCRLIICVSCIMSFARAFHVSLP